jgi:hypothetical protein
MEPSALTSITGLATAALALCTAVTAYKTAKANLKVAQLNPLFKKNLFLKLNPVAVLVTE